VGNIMRACGRDAPCHRVVSAAGALGGYGGNLELKRGLLRAEGILVSATRVRDFAARRWQPAARRASSTPSTAARKRTTRAAVRET